MRSLLLRIFLWYWLANILVFGGLMAVLIWTESGPPDGGLPLLLDRAMATYGQEAVDALETNGPSALRDYVDELRSTTELQVFLFDEQGREVSGQSVPADVQALAVGTLRPGERPDRDRRKPGLLVTQVTGASQGRYAVVGRVPRPAGFPAMPLSALAITAAVVSYWLARYVTAPVRKLRAATQRLADGDLGARVGATVGDRRDVIGDLGRDFDFMAERVEALISVQQRLLCDVSHELRSPLARLNIALGLAARRAGPEATQALDRIEWEAERLNDLIGQLLTLARLDGAGQSLEKTAIDLAELVHRIAADGNFEARSRGRGVRVEEGQECTVLGTPELLHGAIENVVRNAVCYTAEGTEVEITLRRRFDGQDPWAVLCIRDHGAGVPQAALTQIFQPFYRVTDARERQSGGVGLGLAITQRAIKLHGGTVSAANAADGGLIVEVHLPAVRDPHGHAATSATGDRDARRPPQAAHEGPGTCGLRE